MSMSGTVRLMDRYQGAVSAAVLWLTSVIRSGAACNAASMPSHYRTQSTAMAFYRPPHPRQPTLPTTITADRFGESRNETLLE